MPSLNPSLTVEVWRGSAVESTHTVLACVVDHQQKLVKAWGDPEHLTFPRSAIKMLQALPLIESGAAEHFQLSDVELTLACASHMAEPAHIAAIELWLQKIKLQSEALACGAHWPASQKATHGLVRAGRIPQKTMNNCSGKHLGFLTTCLQRGYELKNYHHYDHPLQKELRDVLSLTMGVDHNQLEHGVDGCSITTYVTPLKNIAQGLSLFLQEANKNARTQAAQRLMSAVRQNAFYLAGSEEFTTHVIEKTQGQVIVKIGAEGVFAGILPQQGYSFALKVVDGHKQAAEVACATILNHLGGLHNVEPAQIAEWLEPTIQSWAHENVGRIRVQKSH